MPTPRSLLRRVVTPPSGGSRRIPLGPAKGLRFAAEPAETASADLWVGLFESELAATIRRCARPGTRAVDVGANAGYYTLVLAARTRSRVIAYEPDPSALARLQRNLELNPELAGLVELRPHAVADGATAAGDPGAVTLDADLAAADRPIGLLKIDVDGPELTVLTGARAMLAADRPHVIVETHSAELEDGCARLLVELGYRPRVLTARRRLPQDRGAVHNRWLVADGG